MTRLKDADPPPTNGANVLATFKEEARQGPNPCDFSVDFPPADGDIGPPYRVKLVDIDALTTKYLSLYRLGARGEYYGPVVSLRVTVDQAREIVGFDETVRLAPLQITLVDTREPEGDEVKNSAFILSYRLTDPTNHIATLHSTTRSTTIQNEGGGVTVSPTEIDAQTVVDQHGDWILRPVNLMATTEMYLLGVTPQGDPLTQAYLHERPVVSVDQ